MNEWIIFGWVFIAMLALCVGIFVVAERVR